MRGAKGDPMLLRELLGLLQRFSELPATLGLVVGLP
jgi:hypothetical protein